MGITSKAPYTVADLHNDLNNYRFCNFQELSDKEIMMNCLASYPDILTRNNKLAHFTASSWIVNHEKTKVLMIYHNIYQSWSWTGGHADGEADLCTVALREAYEETGIFIPNYSNEIFSIEVLPVAGHQKKGNWVSSHLHLNVTYLFFADDRAPISVNQNENSDVQWIPIEQAVAISSEREMKPIYEKLNNKLFGYSFLQ